jgi:hypothetical protein
VPVGQVSKNIDEIMGTNTQQVYDGLNYAVRGNFIPGTVQTPEPRRLAKMNPTDVIPPVDMGVKSQPKSVVGANDVTMESADRIDSAKTYKRPSSRGFEIRKTADSNPR